MENKLLTVVRYQQVRNEMVLPIKKVVHGLPTWMFPSTIGTSGSDGRCIACNNELGMTIAHGQHITTCSFIQCEGGYNYPIHTACYNAIGTDINTWDVKHFEHSQNVFDEIKIDYYNPQKP